MEGADNERVFTLRNIPDTYKIRGYVEEQHPKSAVVVGGGYIGVEMAENCSRMPGGIHPWLAHHVIAPLDYDMACDVHRYLKEKGVGLILQNGVQSIREKDERFA